VTYLVGCEVISGQLYISGGNLNGEIYIYTVANFENAFRENDPEKPLPQAELKLVDMVLTGDPFVQRGFRSLAPDLFVSCSEGNKVQAWHFKPQKVDELQSQA
jgi:hypothetical protein